MRRQQAAVAMHAMSAADANLGGLRREMHEV